MFSTEKVNGVEVSVFGSIRIWFVILKSSQTTSLLRGETTTILGPARTGYP